jgi:glycosyltransferase involved in cell wall biosynthesis
MTTPKLPDSSNLDSTGSAVVSLTPFGMKVLKNQAQIEDARQTLQSRGLGLQDVVDVPGRGKVLVGDIRKSWDVLESVSLIERCFSRDAAILDLGTYRSEILGILYRLGYRNLHGVDLHPNVGQMPHADVIRYRIADYHASGFPDASFDVITAISVIEHGFNGPRLIAEISRLLKPGGCFIASVDYWNPKLVTVGKEAYGMDWRIFSAGDLQDFFRMAEAYDLNLPGAQDFEPEEKVIEWNDRQYTFGWFVLTKKPESQPAPTPPKETTVPVPAPKGRRLAFLSTFNQPCGIASHTRYILDGFKQFSQKTGAPNDDILILAEDSADAFPNDPPFVRRCWHRRNENFDNALAHIIKEGVSTLHIQFHGGQFAATHIIPFVQELVRRGIRVVATLHSMETYLPLAAQLARTIDRTFVLLPQAIQRLVAFGADPRRIRVIPLGIQNNRQVLPLALAKMNAGIPADIKLVTSFGFFRPHKGVAEIIQALPDVIRNHPKLFFMFIGGGHRDAPDDVAYYQHCQELTQRLGIARNVDFIYGFVPDEEVSRFLSSSDAIVLNYLQYRNELSLAGTFALSHLRPLITTGTPAFIPLQDCTLQTSVELNLSNAINMVLGQPLLADYLRKQAELYIQHNSYEHLAELLLEEYAPSSQDAARRGGSSPL